TVGLKSVRGWSDRVAGVVARAVRNHSRVTRVVFFYFEDDLHQVRTDVGNLREDAARNPKGRGAKRLADGEANEARAGIRGGDEQENAEHDEQLDADQHHPNAHTGFERDRVKRIRLALEARKSSSRVCKSVDANAEPRHTVAAADSHQAEQEYDDHPHRFKLQQQAEVQGNDHRDECLENENELPLRDEIRFASFVNKLRDFPHRTVHREVLQVHVHDETEKQAQRTDNQTEQQESVAIESKEAHL